MKNYSLKINGHKYDVSIDDLNDYSTKANVVVNGNAYEVDIEGDHKPVVKKPQAASAPAAAQQPVSAPRSAATGGGITSPLPGTVTAINVKVGDKVTAGQTVIILEAMKMENNINASASGTVKSIAVSQGATVAEGDVLIVIE